METKVALEIANNFYFIERGWLNGNHFVLTGPEPVLIDAAYITGREETLAVLDELGVETKAVAKIVLTHTHCDHVGAVAEIQAASKCRVELHRISAHHIRHRNAWATWWFYYDQEAAFFEVGRELDDGDAVEVGEFVFEVIHAPGHAAGQICLFEPAERILISADALWDVGLGVLTPRIEGVDSVFRALDTLDRLETLRPRVVYPGHGPAIEDVEGAIAKAKERLNAFISEPRLQGMDQIKKIIIYTLLMRDGLPAATLFNNLTEAPWFEETVKLFFGRERPRRIFDKVVEELLAKEAIKAEGPFLTALVKA